MNDLSNKTPNLYDVYVKKIEKLLIESTINFCDGKKIRAAKLLGLGRNTITRKISDLDIK